MNARKKDGRSARKKSYFKVQTMRTARNKTNQATKRQRLRSKRPPQPQVESSDANGKLVMVSAILKAKQTNRKRRRQAIVNRIMAQRIVVPVLASHAE